MRFSRPSTGTILGSVALFVALGGTALAATASVVNIADPTTPANKAAVNSSGQLMTAGTDTVSGYVGEAIPKNPFVDEAGLYTGGTEIIIGANKATLALTRLDIQNPSEQTNGAGIEVQLYEGSGTATTCDNSTGSRRIGDYDIPVGQTFSDAMQSPIVLKPLVSGDVWCLESDLYVEGNPTSIWEPGLSFSGYVAEGTLPAGALPSAAPSHGLIRRATR